MDEWSVNLLSTKLQCLRAIPGVLVLAMSLHSAAPAVASRSYVPQSKDLSSPVVKGSKTTCLQLMRKLFPDLSEEQIQDGAGTLHRAVTIRRIEGKGKKTVLQGDVKIQGFEVRPIRSEGRELVLFSVDVSAESANEGMNYEGEASLLAVFSLTPSLRLLDEMDTKTDRFSGFWGERPLIHLDSHNDAFIIYSSHSNSSESYDIINALFVDKGRFKVIADLFILNSQGCGVTFTETPYFRPIQAAGQKYPNVLVKVEVKKEADGEECERRTRGYTRYYQAIYRWNAMKSQYEGDPRQLDRFDKFNQKRF
jgi:hypothetical protein